MNALLWSWSFAGLFLLGILANGVMGSDERVLLNNFNGTNVFQKQVDDPNVLVVELTLVQAAVAEGAVCLDGSVPGYHLYRGYGSGANNWIIQLEGGAWCDSITDCQNRKRSRVGSSTLMEKQINFKGILSNKAAENPDFYNWNKAEVRYCDGASFSGDSENKTAQLQFRGKRIFLAVMEDLMAKGMCQAKQALLNGCSSGGLSAILRCDDFSSLFPPTTKVKCMSDAGFFLDAVDISGARSLRRMYSGVVNTQGLQNMLPRTCTRHLDPTMCLFPQNIINQVKTPLFILNSAFDSWQIENSIAPPSADPSGSWHNCTSSFKCNASQMQFLEGFKMSMLDALKTFSMSSKNGMFIISRWAHCLAERKDTWFPGNSQPGEDKGIAVVVGDWYFERAKKQDDNDDDADHVLVVGLTLVQAATADGAVCLDGSVPGYHLYRGYGSGANNWIIQLQGGAWCDSIEDCQNRKSSSYGSSTLMEKQLNFTGLLSNKAAENPDFYNWNKVKVRYCDGASFSGDSENKTAQLQFRGKRIFLAVMEDLMAKGMCQAKQALLNGCSSGGLSAILRCDDFSSLFPPTTKVKCMSDAGFFLDAADISGDRPLRRMYSGVVNAQCFFPQNIINQVKTPLFILNSAFDSWQIENSIAPPSADPSGSWHNCSSSFKCNASQMQFLEGFKMSMLDALKTFSMSSKNGMFISSRWAHCLAERKDTWFPGNSQPGEDKGIAVAVGDWYFERAKKLKFTD
ncbi:hypothetical protein Bca4012_053632 [Brassica carinata]